MKCTELIIRDHEIIGRSLDILDGMVQKMEDGLRIEIADVTTILKFLRLFVDEYHQTMEENVLFPALMRATPVDSPLHMMVWEHGEERTAMTCIEEALRAKVGKDFVRNSRRLSVVLRNHFHKEDAVLDELAERLLSEAEDLAIVAEFESRRPESQPDFGRLEPKYTPSRTIKPRVAITMSPR